MYYSLLTIGVLPKDCQVVWDESQDVLKIQTVPSALAQDLESQGISPGRTVAEITLDGRTYVPPKSSDVHEFNNKLAIEGCPVRLRKI